MSICFCTLAIHEPYQRRARVLCGDLPQMPWVVLTDAPEVFAGLPIRAIQHSPTGPMAIDYIERRLHSGTGAAAYHDKRFALLAALKDFDTAIQIDADSRVFGFPELGGLSGGLAVLPQPRETIAEHLSLFGGWRTSIFEELARYLTGDASALHIAPWVSESFYAVTKDGQEARFFEAWGRAADFLQERQVYSGEGGVMGLAALCAGWTVDYESLSHVAGSIHHEAGGPKRH